MKAAASGIDSAASTMASISQRLDSAKYLYWRQVAISIFPRFGTILLGFFLARLLVAELGADSYGDWAAISTTFVASSFLTFGVASSFINYVLLHKDASPKKLAILFTNSIAIIVISAVTLSIAVAVAINFRFIGERYATYGPLCVAILIASMVQCLVNSVYQGLSRIHVNEYSTLFIYLILFAGARFFAASTAKDILVIYFTATLLSLIIFGAPIFRAYFVPKLRAVNSERLQKLLSPARWFFFSQVFAFVLYGSDRLLALVLIGPASVTDYDLAMKLLSPLVLASSLLLAPSWSYFGQRSKRAIVKFFIAFECVFLIALVISLTTAKFFPNIVSLLFNYSLNDQGFIVLLVLAIAVQIHTQPYCYYLNAKGKVKIQAILNGIAAVTNIALSTLLSKAFGLSGIVFATIAATTPFFLYSIHFVVKDLRRRAV